MHRPYSVPSASLGFLLCVFLIPLRGCFMNIQKSQLTAGQIPRLQPDLGSPLVSALAAVGGLDKPSNLLKVQLTLQWSPAPSSEARSCSVKWCR